MVFSPANSTDDALTNNRPKEFDDSSRLDMVNDGRLDKGADRVLLDVLVLDRDRDRCPREGVMSPLSMVG